MRTLLFILGGFVLLAVCLGVGKSVSGGMAEGMGMSLIAFAVVKWKLF